MDGFGWPCTHERWTHQRWAESSNNLNSYLCTLPISSHGQLMQWRWECQVPLNNRALDQQGQTETNKCNMQDINSATPIPNGKFHWGFFTEVSSPSWHELGWPSPSAGLVSEPWISFVFSTTKQMKLRRKIPCRTHLPSYSYCILNDSHNTNLTHVSNNITTK